MRQDLGGCFEAIELMNAFEFSLVMNKNTIMQTKFVDNFNYSYGTVSVQSHLRKKLQNGTLN